MDFPRSWPVKPRDHTQAGCFPRARWTKHGKKFTISNLEVNQIYSFYFAKMPAYFIETNGRCGRIIHHIGSSSSKKSVSGGTMPRLILKHILQLTTADYSHVICDPFMIGDTF